ncbi:MAG: hypothetical protein U0R66_12345 [Mycobacterium sp.]
MTEDNTRPISVAELLARNGTIGSPPVGGHRRRKRRNAVSVAELTGEIPIVRTGEIPVVAEEERSNEIPADEVEASEASAALDTEEPGDEPSAEYAEPESAETVVVYSSDDSGAAGVEIHDHTADYTSEYTSEYAEDAVYTDAPDYTPEYVDTEAVEETVVYEDVAVDDEEPVVEDLEQVEGAAAAVEPDEAVAAEEVEVAASEPVVPEPVVSSPPRSGVPWARRNRGPERSHDPRPKRRSSHAEQMSYDPVDESVDIADLVAEQAPDPEELRSYLRSSTGALFSGETVADDLARRGLLSESDEAYAKEDYEDDDLVETPRRGALAVLGSSVVAILQSLLAVVFGAGLFIAFDQLWRWNNIVALALSTLVIVALVVGVHVVRKTEDFVSILIAVAVGILVTFGPLALQST